LPFQLFDDPNPSSENDVELEVVTLSDGVFGADVPTVNVKDGLFSALRLPRLNTSRVGVIVVLGESTDASNIVSETGNNIDPSLGVMDTHGDEEGFLALLGHETKHTGGATATHGQQEDAILLRPGSAVGKVPNTLLDDLEEGVGVGLIDADFDGVRHSVATYEKVHIRDDEGHSLP